METCFPSRAARCGRALYTSRKASCSGFTLIELLLVIGIIAVLAAVVIVAINPTKQMGTARNTQRRSDVNTILNAVYQYAIDHQGNLPGCLSTTGSGNICLKGSACLGVTDGCELDALTPTYVVDIPKDPSGATGNDTNYDASATSGRVTVSAPKAEQSQTISVTR